MIRIIHTADNHIGKPFRSRAYSARTREALIEERFLAFQRVVEAGNLKQAHFLVIAGDLFDSLHVSRKDIQRIVDIVQQFEGEAVLILPGNHDFFERSTDGLWASFQSFCSDERIVILSDYHPIHFTIGTQTVTFFPAPCRSRHSECHEIGWIIDSAKNSSSVNIGIAHGNVDGFGYDGHRYFNMSVAELESAGMDTWLLGHIHVPHPAVAQQTKPLFFYPATHTPDDINCRHQGTSWFLEIDSSKNIRMEQVRTGALAFHQLSVWVNSIEEIIEMERMLANFPPDTSLIRLEITGCLSLEERRELDKLLGDFQRFLLHFEVELNVAQRIDQAFINQNYSADTLPYQLLQSLGTATEHSFTLQLANQLIQQASL